MGEGAEPIPGTLVSYLGERADPLGRESPKDVAFHFCWRGGWEKDKNKIKQMQGVVELRKNNLFFMSLLAFVKLSK